MDKEILCFLWSCTKGYRLKIILILQAPLIASCFVPVTQYAIKITLDILSEDKTFILTELFLPICLFVFGQLISELSWSISNFVNYKSVGFIKVRLIDIAYSRVIDSSYKYFQDYYSGTISSKISDIQKIPIAIFNNIKLNIINRLTIIFSTCILFFLVSPLFLITILIFYVIFFPSIYFLSKRLKVLSEEHTYEKQQIFGRIVDSISNIFSVLLFSGQNEEKRSVRFGLRKTLFFEQKMLRYEFLLNLFVGCAYFIISVSILFLLIYLRKQKAVTIGDFALILGTLFHTLEVSYALINNLVELMKDWGELKESFKLLGINNDNKISIKDKEKILVAKPTIIYDSVVFSYGDNEPVFSGLSLFIQEFEKVGIVGASGVGKSTLIHLLMRHFDLTSGRILLDFQDIQCFTENSVKSYISIVPQETILFHRTIKDNIIYGSTDVSEEALIRATQKSNIYNFITSLPQGFNTMVGERGVKLSGGQRQKIAIARAFLKDAPILILDEATSNLDSDSEYEIQKSLFSLAKNRTVIAIAHRLSTLKDMDRIIVLGNGKVLEEGSHANLIKNQSGYYKQIWERQKHLS